MKTIVAAATPLLNSAIHIIRISGPDTFTILNKVSAKPIELKPNTIQRNQIVVNNQIIDDVLYNVFIAPKSYTGENLVEINCHGNVLITKKIMSILVLNGAEYAKPGEFSMQALINQKMNYSQIEATNNLINATNEVASAYAINAVLGYDNKKIQELKDKIFMITGSIEVNIDYPEYDDVPQYTNQEIIDMLNPIVNELNDIYNTSNRLQPVFSGFKVAIVGKPNAGKSSLLNALTKKEKAIVSDIKGTTRDVVESDIVLNGISIKLLDTAGIRESNDAIESQGIKKSLDAINEANLVIYLKDSTDIEDDPHILNSIKDKDYIEVYNKKDLKEIPNHINISIKNNDINELLDVLEQKINTITYNNDSSLVLQSSRQINLLKKVIDTLNEIKVDVANGVPLDLVQTSFELSINLLNEILGISFEYDKLDDLFKNFCLGK